MHKPRTPKPSLSARAVQAALLALPLAAIATIAAASPAAHAQTAQLAHDFDIPAGTLSTGLTRLATQAGMQLTANGELTAGKSAPALKGRMTVRQALDRLLAGSGLEAGVDGMAVVLRPSPAARAEREQVSELGTVVVTNKRANRVSKGATGLPLEIKDTPQSISSIDQAEMSDYGVTGSNDALRLLTGINVEQYETNRAVFNARGFDIQLTQIDGLGMSNDWGTVVGQLDTFLFDKIELIRGANGLLTGVGNSSGTINYVRKRPRNKDEGEVGVTVGAHGLARGTLDYNKVLTGDGRWAGRLVVAHEDKDSHLRALHDKRSTVYGVIDGQIGTNGMLTLGFTHQDSKQKSPMWGSLTLNRVDGSQAEFDVSASTSVDWAYWNVRSNSAFIEYTHGLGQAWEAKLTYNKRRADEDTRMLYAYSPTTGALNLDNTGLSGWPYAGVVSTDNDLLDANISGEFTAFGRQHSLIAGISHSIQDTRTAERDVDPAAMLQPLPAFPYSGDAYPEPAWGAVNSGSTGKQKLTRFYAASKLAVTDALRLIVGANAIKLQREGSSRYGNTVTSTGYPDTKETSPYLGVTYDFTPGVMGYASYSDIFQNQDQTDIDGNYLAPMKGVNLELGVKADWLERKLLTTFAVFGAKQEGLATYAGINPATSLYWYVPKDVESKGIEFEATGRIGRDSRLSLGLTRLELTGPDGADIYEWVPRTTVNLRFDTQPAALPKLKWGIGGRWQSDVHKVGGARQDAFLLANAFASWQLSNDLVVRLNINNLFDKKYVGGIQYGAIYGAPRNVALSLEYKL